MSLALCASHPTPLAVEALTAALAVACAPLTHLGVTDLMPPSRKEEHHLIPAVACPVEHERRRRCRGEVLNADEVVHCSLPGLPCQWILTVEATARLLCLGESVAQGERCLLAPALHHPPPVPASVALPEGA